MVILTISYYNPIPPELKWKIPFTPYSGFTPGIRFLPNIPLPGGGILPTMNSDSGIMRIALKK